MTKIVNQFLFLVLAVFFFLTSPIFAAGPSVAGHYLTTGQVLVGVTGSAPVANQLIGTSGQIVATQGAEGGYMQLSFPTNVQMTNLTVTGTLSPYSTGTFTSDNLTANYGVAAATGVFSGAVTGASFAATAALSAGTSATVVGAAYIGAAGTVSTITAAGAATFNTSVTAPAITGSTSVSGGTLAATAGGFSPYSRSLAQLNALNPGAAGKFYFCNDCLSALAVSTGNSVGAFVTNASSTTHIN